MPPRPGRPSIGGKSTGHYLASKTSAKTTTKDVAVVAGDVLGTRIRSADQAELNLDALPEYLRTDVAVVLTQAANAQLFADLFAARLERDPSLPQEKRLGSPILWLRQMVRLGDKIDFSPAEAFAAKREAAKLERRQAAERLVREVEAERLRKVLEAERLDAARRSIESMSDEERQAIVTIANAGQRARRAASEAEQAVLAGRLPEHPLARASVLKALATTGSVVTTERRAT